MLLLLHLDSLLLLGQNVVVFQLVLELGEHQLLKVGLLPIRVHQLLVGPLPILLLFPVKAPL